MVEIGVDYFDIVDIVYVIFEFVENVVEYGYVMDVFKGIVVVVVLVGDGNVWVLVIDWG